MAKLSLRNLKLVASLLLVACVLFLFDNNSTVGRKPLTRNSRYLEATKENSRPYDPYEASLSTPLLPINVDTVVPPEERKPLSEIRYAAFGSSVTWGAGHGHGELEHRKSFAYPWLLSPDATNFAIRAGGPAYPAACTSTMIGEDVFDVVVLEYFVKAKEGVALLARRIRERFPDAIIIFLMNWNPSMVGRCRHSHCHSGAQNMFEWAKEKGYDVTKGDLHNQEMHKLFRESEETWMMVQYSEESKRKVLYDAAREVGGYVIPNPEPENAKDWVDYATDFAHDAFHFSMKGHRGIAQRVRDLVEWHGVPQNPRLQNFMEFDQCTNWFESGDMDGIKYSSTGIVEKMPNTQKFALSFEDGDEPDAKTDGKGWIGVTNPSNRPLSLYLGYMITGPSPNLYPRTEVIIESEGGDIRGEPVVLEGDKDSVYGKRAVHISKIMKAGIIDPGYSIVRFSELEQTERPFRLVSVMLASYEDSEISELPGGNEN